MSTDAGSAAAPEDTATREESSERPGLESEDPQSADSATSTPETADRGVEGSASSGPDRDPETDADAETEHTDAATADDDVDAETDTAETDTAETDTGASEADVEREDSPDDEGTRDRNPANEGFFSTMLRDSTITGLPGETGAPPAEPHAPEAQQEGDEPVGSEPREGDNPDGVD